MKKFISVILAGVFVFFSQPIIVFETTPGKLKSSSICTGNNGVTYGNHGDGHWHVAAERSSGWYPQGESLGHSNPCKTSSPASVNEEWGGNDNLIPAEEEIIVNSSPYFTIEKDYIEKKYSEISQELDVSDILELFNVKAFDEEDGDIAANIKANKDILHIQNNDETHTISLEVNDSNNAIAKQELYLKIYSRANPNVQVSKTLTFSKHPTCQEIIDNNYFDVIDADNLSLKFACSNISVNKKEKTLFLDVVDSYGVQAQQYFQYEVDNSAKKVVTLVLIVISVIIITIYLNVKFIAKTKTKKSDKNF